MRPCKGCRFWRELSEADQVSPTVRLGQCRKYAPKPGSAVPFHVVWAGCGQREPIDEVEPAAGQAERLLESTWPVRLGESTTLTGRDEVMSTFTTQLHELAPAGGRVERTTCTIRNCRVLGIESANGRRYSQGAIEKAKPLYEGKAVFLDHLKPNEKRRYQDRVGRIVNVRVDGGGLRGDLVLSPGHPMTETLLWDSEHQPNALGLSHDATGTLTRGKDGVHTVESIDKVMSVDVVLSPATSSGIFEHRETTPEPPAWTVAEMREEVAKMRQQLTGGKSKPATSTPATGGEYRGECFGHLREGRDRDITATVARWRE